MTAPLNKIAKCYGTSRQALTTLKARHSLTVADLLKPERVFTAMLTARTSPLRSRLADPVFLAQLTARLSNL